MKIYEPHALAKKVPLMKGDDFEELKESIRQQGCLIPGVLLDGKLLDGRNRQEACKQLGVPFHVIPFDTKRGMSPARFVESINVVRRHLTETQKGTIALALLPFFQAEAKERQKKAAKDKRPKSASSNAFKEKPSSPKRAIDEAAKAVGAKPRTLARVQFVKEHAPELVKKMFDGEMTAKQAEKQIKRTEQIKQIKAYVPPTGKFQVIAVDFSWTYRDALDGPGMDRALPYPPMSVEEILAFVRGPLAACADPEACVLACWVTNPIMLDLLTWPAVQHEIEMWLGFRPRKLRTWHKTDNGHDFTGLGTGPRNDTEQLVIFTRGSVLFNETGADHAHPLQRTFFSADVGANSEKPAKAYEDLEAMVPYTRRLELFARGPRKGWVTSGSELPETAAGGDAAPAAGRPGGANSEQPDAAMPGGSFSHPPGAASSGKKSKTRLFKPFVDDPPAVIAVKDKIERLDAIAGQGAAAPSALGYDSPLFSRKLQTPEELGVKNFQVLDNPEEIKQAIAEEAAALPGRRRLEPHSFRGVAGGRCFDCEMELDHLLHRGHLTQAQREATAAFEPASRIEPPTLGELAEAVRPGAQSSDVATPESLKPVDPDGIDF